MEEILNIFSSLFAKYLISENIIDNVNSSEIILKRHASRVNFESTSHWNPIDPAISIVSFLQVFLFICVCVCVQNWLGGFTYMCAYMC